MLGLTGPKLNEKVHISAVLLTFLCLMRPFWKFHIDSNILVKSGLKFHPLVGNFKHISTHFGPLTQN